jgi:hypothetical protein
MLKVRVVILALAAVLVASASASAVAQAAKGPVWHVNEKVLATKEVDATTASLVEGTVAKLEFTVAGTAVNITCQTVMSSGELVGGNPGKDKEEIRFSKCHLLGSEEGKCTVLIAPTHALSELDHAIAPSTKMLVDFYPEAGKLFTTITIAGPTCLTKVSGAQGQVTMAAGAGYGIACETSPEEREAVINTLHCPETAIQEVEQGEQGQRKIPVGLAFDKEPMTFAAQIGVHQVSQLPFGPFQS